MGRNVAKRLFGMVLVVVMVMSLTVGCSSDSKEDEKVSAQTETVKKKEIIKLRIGAGHVAENIAWTGTMDTFFGPEVSKRVSETTDYEIEWIKGYGGSIVKLGEAMEGVQAGLIDIAYVNFGFEPSKLMMHGMTFRMPFQSPDSTVVSEVALTLFDEYPEVFVAPFEDYNQKFLGLGVTDNYSIYSTYEINSIADVDGKKFGAGGANLSWIEGTGAVGVQSSLNDAYTSLQTGVYDGCINPTSACYNFKIQEVAPYVIKLNFGAQMAGAMTMNLDKFNSLPTEVQDIIVEVGQEYSAQEAKNAQEKYDSDLKAMAADGIKIIEITDEARREWVESLPNIVGNMVDENNEKGLPATEIVNRYYELLEEKGFENPRNWEF